MACVQAGGVVLCPNEQQHQEDPLAVSTAANTGHQAYLPSAYPPPSPALQPLLAVGPQSHPARPQ
jgi:hypothetical protein